MKSDMVKYAFTVTLLMTLTACKSGNYNSNAATAALGEKLFNDVSLSRDGRQACASCHNANHAFIDARLNITSIDTSTPGAVSSGQDDTALGDINSPSAAYAAFIPDFYYDEVEGLFKGGLFLNGRAKNLVEQAKQPFLNPAEMQTTKEDVVAKVRVKYGETMQSIYGINIFNSVDDAYNAIASSIAAFEKTERFSPFDSKFDRVLRGEAEFTAEESLGLDVFVAEDKGNCAACHPVPLLQSSKEDSLFTDFTYDNLGVPKNSNVRSFNGKDSTFIDYGLFNNPEVDNPDLKGAFRVSGLRNIAVTSPYMHNGLFRDLKTVIHFYNTRDVAGAINPETNEFWKPAEVEVTKNTDELGNLGLTEEEENAIVAFLKTLTDSRYEHLIP